MTEHMDLGSTPNFVERPAARHNQTIRVAATHRLLADPIEFSQNMARIITTGILDDVLIQDTSKRIDDIRSEFEYLMDQAVVKNDMKALNDVHQEYVSFVTYAEGDAREYGIALGVVMEQLRVGLGRVVDLRNRGPVFGDVQAKTELGRLRLKRGLSTRPARREKDDAA